VEFKKIYLKHEDAKAVINLIDQKLQEITWRSSQEVSAKA
jgi:hypothetical protein